jgi:hypothetical protein
MQPHRCVRQDLTCSVFGVVSVSDTREQNWQDLTSERTAQQQPGLRCCSRASQRPHWLTATRAA